LPEASLPGLLHRLFDFTTTSAMTVVAFIINLCIIGSAGYYLWRRVTIGRKFFVPALVIKLAAGMCLGLLYKYYYTVGDTFTYFEEGRQIANIARTDPGDYLNFLFTSSGGNEALSIQAPRALFLSKIVSLFNLITVDNYWLISIYFSSAAFAAAWFLFSSLAKEFPKNIIPAAFAFLFFPSIVFWSSGIVKESVSTASLFFLSGVFFKVWVDRKVTLIEWILVPIAAWLLWSLKYYVVAVLFLVVGTALIYKFVVTKRMTKASFVLQIGACVLIMVLPSLMIVVLHPNLYPHQLIEVIVENNRTFLQLSEPGDAIVFSNLQPNFFSLLLNAPNAMFSGLYRPLLWEASNVFQLTIALENFLMLAVSLFSLRYIGTITKSPHRILIVLLIFYVTTLCVFLSLSSPNFGTLARYRVAFLPFFVLLIFSCRPMVNLLNRAFGSLVQ
jgi:hypothetical protein